ncbi:putative Group 1 glycosyl transferase [Candidatus Zixiibacteriota bacterium]|nr:putative Group 1 glycosyl transferase [candidate division Zixibacteria bacterium]
MSPKKLLIITNRFPAGPDDPASPFIYDFKMALKRRGISCDIITPYYRPHRDDTRYLNNDIHRFDWSDGTTVISQLPLYDPRSWLKIRRYLSHCHAASATLLQKNEYSAILALWALPSGYIARKLFRRFGVPYSVWALGSDINNWARRPLLKKMITDILKDASALYADGYELAAKTETLAGKSCRFLPSYHAIDIESAGGLPGEKYFLCLGRLEKEKGIFDLLDAFLLFSRNHPEWRLYFVGSGRATETLRKRINSYRLDDRVRCTGYLERKAANRLLLQCRAIIIPSHSDSLPLTFGEAMQAGRPVIASEIGDMPLFIDKYRVGLHYPVGNIEALCDRMTTVSASDTELVRNCPEVIKELDINNAAAEISRWLDSLRLEKQKDVLQYADA